MLPAILLLIEVDTCVNALVVFHKNVSFRQGLIVWALAIRHKDVVILAGRNANREFAPMVGISLPPELLLLRSTQLKMNAIKRMLARSPDGTED
jgi:hypothetical protein